MPPGIDEDAIREFGQFARQHYMTYANERHRRAIETDQPFVERLVHFWSNHFAVSADKLLVGPLAGLYEQEAIRPRVTGNFYDLLLAAERHPAMNLYLDNTASMGEGSTAARLARNRGRELGLNENLAREILELHTLGVDGGYDQHDVTEFAKVITGWSIGGPIGPGAGGLGRPAANGAANGPGNGGPAGNPRAAAFAGGEPGRVLLPPADARARRQDRARQALQGTRRRGRRRGARDARDSIPRRAKHLATKLARHFVADDPPAALVDRLADVYLKNDGELVPVYRALIAADDSWRQPLAKYKTPQDFVLSTFRALDHVPGQPAADHRHLGRARPAAVHARIARRLARRRGELGRQRRALEAHRVGRGRRQARRRGREGLRRRGSHGRRSRPASTTRRSRASRGASDAGQGLALLIAAPEFQRR